jgi:hypothetical protein
MYINPVVVGVVGTLFVELVAFFVYGITLNKRGK